MGLFRELHYGARSLRATPTFTIAAIAILALGIGTTTAVFSVVHGLLLQPLPVRDPARLVRIWKNDLERGFEHVPLSYPEYLYWEERASGFESIAALWSWGADEGVWKVDGQARRIHLEKVSTNFFDVLGVEVVYGRSFVREDENRTALPPIVLSYQLFRSHFGEDSSIVGRSLPIHFGERSRFEVVGVLPPGFHLSSPVGGYVPTLAIDRDWLNGLGCECDVIARLRHGVPMAAARAQLQTIQEQHAEEHAAERYRPMEVVMIPLLDTIVGAAGTTSLFLFGAVCLLLALATANLAGLYLTRTAERQRELAVRAAMGAGRGSLIRHMAAETLLVAALGLIGGFFVADWGVDLLLALGGSELPRVEGIGLDPTVLSFAALVAVTSTLCFGLWPALRASRLDLIRSLKGRTVGFMNTRLVGRLVVVEIAIAFVLLTASSLLLRSLAATASIERGFRTEKLVSIAIPLPAIRYPDVADRVAFYRRLEEEVGGLPAVVGATPSFFRPGGGWAGISASVHFEGQTEDEARENPMASFEWVAPSYFRVTGIPIVRGRAFDATDRIDSEPVVIVSESIARTYWPGEDPIGKWLAMASKRSRVVGVTADTRFRELRRSWHSVYSPLEQNPFGGDGKRHPFSTPHYLLVHTALDPEVALGPVLDRIRTLDADIPLDDVATFEALVERELTRPRFHAFLSSAFSLVGLVLAATGIYGVIASLVAQRLPELGLRLALGATPGQLQRSVVGRGFQMSVPGVALGIALAVPCLRWARGLLYGVSPGDMGSFAAVAFVLALVSLAAVSIPARGVSRADPMTLLREE